MIDIAKNEIKEQLEAMAGRGRLDRSLAARLCALVRLSMVYGNRGRRGADCVTAHSATKRS
jgi:hypothetical protein